MGHQFQLNLNENQDTFKDLQKLINLDRGVLGNIIAFQNIDKVNE